MSDYFEEPGHEFTTFEELSERGYVHPLELLESMAHYVATDSTIEARTVIDVAECADLNPAALSFLGVLAGLGALAQFTRNVFDSDVEGFHNYQIVADYATRELQRVAAMN